MLENLRLLKNDIIQIEESIKNLSYTKNEEVYVIEYLPKEKKYDIFKGVVICKNTDNEPHPKYMT